MKKLTADQVIKASQLSEDRHYMQTDTGSVDTGAGWMKTLRDLEARGELESDVTNLVEVFKDDSGNWVEA